jgi:hypothetical protein
MLYLRLFYKNTMLTKENYFSTQQARYRFLAEFYRQISGLKLVGRILEIHLSFEIVPFLFSLYLKSGGYKYFGFLVKTYTYQGICVAVKSSGFSSSVFVRNVSGAVTYDRFIHFFSPLVIKLKYVRPVVSGAFLKKTFKAKLYFFKGVSQKKLIANLFK